MKQVDIVARLLATENLTITRDNVRTASFDLVNRVLTMPIFHGITDSIEEMMVGHEVGHAKHTTWKHWEEALKTKHLPHYFNIVEDSRIEKLMKREYPGLRKTMTVGYGELNKMDFFGVKKMKLDELNLIDRSNLYYKVGHDCGVEFTDEEFELVAEVAGTETERQALELARKILEFVKGKLEDQSEDQEDGESDSQGKGKSGKSDSKSSSKQKFHASGESEGDGESGSGSKDSGDESSSSGSGGESDSDSDADGQTTSPSGEVSDDGDETTSSSRKKTASKDGSGGQANPLAQYLAPKTVEAFNKKLENFVDMHTKFKYFQIDQNYAGLPVIINYKRIMQETSSIDQEAVQYANKISEILRSSSLAINYMIKEFEVRKSAETNKRITISKSGSLDMGKIFAYKIKDDLFRRNSVIPRGKNHGMVMLVDWSGSMDGCIDHVIRQVVDMSTFCRRTQIPFDVFAFTTGYKSHSAAYRSNGYGAQPKSKPNAIKSDVVVSNGGNNFNLLQLLSSDMTALEFNTMIKRLLTGRLQKKPGYGLGGTPLNESLMYMLKYLPEFQQRHRVEKMTFVTLTDGEGSPMQEVYGQAANKNYIRDPVTKKQYPIGMDSTTQSQTLLKMMKDRYPIASIGFHIVDGAYGLEAAIYQNYGTDVLNSSTQIKKMAKDAKPIMEKDGIYAMKSNARDLTFIMGKTALQENLLKNTSKTDLEIFHQQMMARKASRILLDKFIATIA